MTYPSPFQDIEEGKLITSFNKLKGTWVYDLLKEGVSGLVEPRPNTNGH